MSHAASWVHVSLIGLLLAIAGAFAQPGSALGQTAESRTVKLARAQGVIGCADEMDKVAQSFEQTGTGLLGTWSKEGADSRLFHTMLVTPYSDGRSVSSLSAVKNASGRCDVIVTQVLPVTNQSCAALRDTAFKEWTLYTELAGAPVYEHASGNTLHVTLLPLPPSGCLIIKNVVNCF